MQIEITLMATYSLFAVAVYFKKEKLSWTNSLQSPLEQPTLIMLYSEHRIF